MIIRINKNDFLKEVVQKTIISFEDKLGVYLEIEENYYFIHSENESFDKEVFLKELTFNDLRYQISKQTDTIKKLIIGRALYDTCIKVR